MNNLAIVYRAIGDVPRATEMFLRSLHIWEKAVGPYHRSTLLAVGNLAQLYWDTGEVSRAIPLQRRADAIVEKQLELNLAIGSERQKLAFVKSISERTDRTISLHLHAAPGDADAGALAALVVLQRKGRVLDAMTDAFSAVRRRVDDGGGRALLDQLNSTTARLARLALNAADDESADQRQRAIGELEAEKERLEVELGAYSGELRAQIQPVTLEAVQAALPEDAALLEFAIFRPFNPTVELNADAYGPPHYAAYVVRKHAAPRGVDLGPAAAIDRAVDAAAASAARSDADRRERTCARRLRCAVAALARRIWGRQPTARLTGWRAQPRAVRSARRRRENRADISSSASRSVTSAAAAISCACRCHACTAVPPVIVADPDYGEPAPRPPDPQRRKQPSTACAVSQRHDRGRSGGVVLRATGEYGGRGARHQTPLS